VSGVAHNLHAEFTRMQVPADMLTADTLFPALQSLLERLPAKFSTAVDVVTFSVLGTLAMAFRRLTRPGEVYIVHNDVLGGHIYVNHGLHKELVAIRGRRMLLNPLHLFLFLREAVRHRLALYRTVVCLSSSGEAQLRDNYAIGNADVRVIPNGVDLRVFHPSEPEPARELGSALDCVPPPAPTDVKHPVTVTGPPVLCPVDGRS